MYTFPEDLKKAYEKLAFPMLFAIRESGTTIPLLITDGFLRLYGLSRESYLKDFGLKIGNNLFSKIHPDEIAKVKKITDDFFEGKTDYDVTFRARLGDGYHTIHAAGFRQAMPDGREISVVGFADMNKYEDTIAKIADKYHVFEADLFYTDPLTELPNLNYLHKFVAEFAKEILAHGNEPFLAYVDVDSMQSYNTRYGIEGGDRLLQLVAAILKEVFPKALICRGADDHFILVDTFVSKEDLIKKLNCVNRRIRKEAAGTTTGIHVGIHVHTNFIDSKKALDNAKRACRNIGDDMNIRYRFYSNDEKDKYLRQRYIIENFKDAINNGWFTIFYQCFLRLETGKGYGFEALARWVDPEIGVIPPSQFIPALEQYHLMHELDLFMFEQVCREVKPRYEAGLPLMPVSVNFSRQDFDYINVPEELNKIIDHYNIGQYGIDKSYFIIEITEQDMATATEAFYKQLAEIRESGFQVWIDDFGSGYSSLNVFSRFNIDLIKFDMELLKNLDEHNGANREIIKAMIRVAKKLGVHTLCEGMETEAQKEFLRDAGCELAQGYLYHKPEPLSEIFSRLELGIPIPANETPLERIEFAKKWIQ